MIYIKTSNLIAAIIYPLIIGVLAVCKRDLLGRAGLRSARNIKETAGLALPLLLLPIVNLYLSLPCLYSGESRAAAYICNTVVLISAAFIEELCFRGILPRLLQRLHPFRLFQNAVLTSFIFALSHAVNMLTGSQLHEVLIQCAFAFGVGLCLAALADKSGSVWPGIIIHGLINITAGTDTDLPSHTAFWLITSAFCSCYGIWMLTRNNRKEGKNEV